MLSLNGLFNHKAAGNHDYKEPDNINSVQSSLKSHPLWLTLYQWFPNEEWGK